MKIQFYALSVTLLFATSAFSQSPSWMWGKRIGGTADIKARDITTTPMGNSYVTGYFLDTLKIGNFTLVSADSGIGDTYVAGFDPNGSCLWVIKSGGNGGDGGESIKVDYLGNIFLAGSFRDTVIFGSDTLIAVGSDDVFYAKLNPAGNVIWAKREGGLNSEYPKSIGLDTMGNIYLAGKYLTATTFDSFSVTSLSGEDTFVAKIDSLGNTIWLVSAGGPGGSGIYASATDAFGNTYLTGSFNDSICFGNDTLIPRNNWEDIFTSKCDMNGNFVWAKRLGGPYWDYAKGIGFDQMGNVFVTGNFYDSVYFGPYSIKTWGLSDVYLAKYDQSGLEKWIRKVGGPAEDWGADIATDKVGNSYLCGYYRDWIYFSTDLPPLDTALSFIDFFACNFDSAGNFKWFKTASGYINELARAISIDTWGNSYLVGTFDSTCYFAPVDSISNYVFGIGAESFIAKIDNVVVAGIDDEYLSNSPIHVFPNPADGLFYVSTQDWLKGVVTVHDLTGRIILQESIQNTVSEIDIRQHPPGVYFISLSKEGHSVRAKLIRQ